MFCVLNHCGEVITWQLTHSVSFQSIQPILQGLKKRFDNQGEKLEEFYIDNCCSWRKKLQSVFGTTLKVYLDLFHAVKPIGEKISKKHPLRKECMDALRLVSRDPTHLGKERHKPTPSPDVLPQRMERFEGTWSAQGMPILNEAPRKEINHLKKHIRCGCLSGIGPGRGTGKKIFTRI